MSPSSRRAWIEMMNELSEEIDAASPSSRRAWIEMLENDITITGFTVALLAEGVDRNAKAVCDRPVRASRPPRGGRG